MIFVREINKISEFYMIFARKMPEFDIIIAQKIFFPNFFGRGGGHVPPAPPPISHAYDVAPANACQFVQFNVLDADHGQSSHGQWL